MRGTRHKGRLFYTYLLSFLLILIVPVIFSTLVFGRARSILTQEAGRANELLLLQMKSFLDTIMSDVAQLNYIVANHVTLGGMLFETLPVSNDEIYRAYRVASDLYDYDTSSAGSTDLYVYLPRLDMVISPRGYTTTANYQMAQRPLLDDRLRRMARVVRRSHPAALSRLAEHESRRGGARHRRDGHAAAGVAAHRLPARLAGDPHRARSVPAHLCRHRLDARLGATRLPPRVRRHRRVRQRRRPRASRGCRRARARYGCPRPGHAGRRNLHRQRAALRRRRLVLRLAGARRSLCATLRRPLPVHDPGADRVRDHRRTAHLLAGLGRLPADPGSHRAGETGRQRHPDAAIGRVRAHYRIGAEHAAGGPPVAHGTHPVAAAAVAELPAPAAA